MRIQMNEDQGTAEQSAQCINECSRPMLPWDFLDRMAKHKQREILGAANEVMELEQLADWLRSMQHKIPEHLLPILVRLIAKADR